MRRRETLLPGKANVMGLFTDHELKCIDMHLELSLINISEERLGSEKKMQEA